MLDDLTVLLCIDPIAVDLVQGEVSDSLLIGGPPLLLVFLCHRRT